jgi:hypothetical protein
LLCRSGYAKARGDLRIFRTKPPLGGLGVVFIKGAVISPFFYGMNFANLLLNVNAMKNLVFALIAAILISSCTASKENSTTKADKKAADKEEVKRAVESRQYVIKMDKIYMQAGGATELVPNANFFIMNGEIASVSLAYIGKSYYMRPITGINFNGQTTRYEMQSDAEKGMYTINVEITKGADKFNFYLSIGTSGYCNISLNNPYIQSVSYRGKLVPLRQTQEQPEVKKEKI